ncbi:MAG: PEP-CTERM sorting domain-containing protein, partial [Burkholderiales bacterium]
VTIITLTGLFSSLHAQGVLLHESFSTYSNGDLVGQNGWTQILASSTVPLQVSNGQLLIPFIALGGATADNQDAAKSFTTVPSPGVGTTSVFTGMSFTVTNATTNGSYFYAMTDIPTGFANIRITARDNSATIPNTFQLGGRVTGQAGYPYVYGAALSYNTTYRVIVQAEMNSGAQNDRVLVYVDPTDSILGNQTPYLISAFTSGAGTDPVALGLAIFSQFANATTGEAGINIFDITVADNFAAAVPEPTTYALLAVTGLTGAGYTLLRRYRRNKRR